MASLLELTRIQPRTEGALRRMLRLVVLFPIPRTVVAGDHGFDGQGLHDNLR